MEPITQKKTQRENLKQIRSFTHVNIIENSIQRLTKNNMNEDNRCLSSVITTIVLINSVNRRKICVYPHH